eukprot:1766533-Prymnesium_polylepis.2
MAMVTRAAIRTRPPKTAHGNSLHSVAEPSTFHRLPSACASRSRVAAARIRRSRRRLLPHPEPPVTLLLLGVRRHVKIDLHRHCIDRLGVSVSLCRLRSARGDCSARQDGALVARLGVLLAIRNPSSWQLEPIDSRGSRSLDLGERGTGVAGPGTSTGPGPAFGWPQLAWAALASSLDRLDCFASASTSRAGLLRLCFESHAKLTDWAVGESGDSGSGCFSSHFIALTLGLGEWGGVAGSVPGGRIVSAGPPSGGGSSPTPAASETGASSGGDGGGSGSESYTVSAWPSSNSTTGADGVRASSGGRPAAEGEANRAGLTVLVPRASLCWADARGAACGNAASGAAACAAFARCTRSCVRISPERLLCRCKGSCEGSGETPSSAKDLNLETGSAEKGVGLTHLLWELRDPHIGTGSHRLGASGFSAESAPLELARE